MRRPPIDPEIAEALETTWKSPPSLSPEDIPRIRSEFSASAPPVADPDQYDSTVYELNLLLWKPKGSTSQPCIYHVHGGGLVFGRASDDMPRMAKLGSTFNMATASIEYRLAPEHPYPAALEDVVTGFEWLTRNASQIGISARDILLSGSSAGGGLAAAATLFMRDHGGPLPLGLLLMCPMLDDRNNSHSGYQMEGAGSWDRIANETGWSAYLGKNRSEVPIYASPSRAQDLSDLPPIFLDVGSAETFRDEVVAFAAHVWSCGGQAELHVWPGGTHGFEGIAENSLLAQTSVATRYKWVERLLRQRGSTRQRS